MSSSLKLDDYIRQTRDRFVYVRLDAPNFPPDHHTNTFEQFAKLRDGVEQILARTRKIDRRRWLEMVLTNLEQAFSAYQTGNRNRGIDCMYAAEEHFKNAIHGKQFEKPNTSDATTTPVDDDAQEAFFAEEVRFETEQAKGAEPRFEKWLKDHPESEWHKVLPKTEKGLLGRIFSRLTRRNLGKK